MCYYRGNVWSKLMAEGFMTTTEGWLEVMMISTCQYIDKNVLFEG